MILNFKELQLKNIEKGKVSFTQFSFQSVSDQVQ